MAVKKRGLGRGLDALLGNGRASMPSSLQEQAADATQGLPAAADKTRIGELATKEGRDGELESLPVEFIQPGKFQPRLDMQAETLEDLANSIRAQGVMQPIVVRSVGPNRYEIIAGERRWRAAQLAGLDRIPALIRQVPDEAAIAMALIENIQREDLNPIEEAMALKRLQEEFNLTQQEVADAVGKSRAAVTNLMRLMGLTLDVRKYLEHGDLEMGHARALLTLPAESQASTARAVIGRGLSVRQTEALVRKLQAEQGKTKTPGGRVDPDIKNLEEDLSGRLGTQVLVQHSAKGKGRLILKYSSLDQLDGILAHIR
ncbi:MAG: ParB/RepB/Spo0J family partition protein [Pseudomonadales bacterium]|nr:ParB/RepB/Spo0J family partition protein [Pseudomonadales bacterium]